MLVILLYITGYTFLFETGSVDMPTEENKSGHARTTIKSHKNSREAIIDQ